MMQYASHRVFRIYDEVGIVIRPRPNNYLRVKTRGTRNGLHELSEPIKFELYNRARPMSK